jgi:predicted ATPase
VTRPTGTVTFLFTDVEGSTRLLHEVGGDRYASLLGRHRRALREAFARHGGVEVDTQGDAFFYAFARASDAVEAARDGQDALADGPIRVRMGLHTGEPVATEEGYVGLDVHRAARIAAAGHGGQVLLSAATRDLAGADVRDLGEHRLKDLSAPERIYQLGDGEFPPLKTLYGTNLPVPATPFLGRERELREVAALLARGDTRLLTLTGAGGSGKTRLALQAAAAAADDYPQGVWWVPLAPLGDHAAVLETTARALGSTAPLAEVVGDRRLLLLLDNFEHVIAAAGELAALLRACPGLDLLVTSRERLRLAGEQVYPVPTLARDDALELFTARARAVRPDFVPDAALDDLCGQLDDLPLALELAAARTALLSTGQLVARLGGRLDLLRGGRDADVRQQTLRATIQWSYDLLEPGEQWLLATLAVFRGGCTLEAAEAVCAADLEPLQSLVDKSLIRVADGRFWMLETLREFADERLEETGESAAARRAHAEFFRDLAVRADVAGEVTDPEQLGSIRVEQDNFRAALEWSSRHDPELALGIAAALEGFWVVAGPSEGMRWLGQLLEQAREAPLELRAHALRAYGGAANPAGRNDIAEPAYAESLAAFRRLGDGWNAARLVLRLGYAAFYRDDLDGARALAEESLSSFEATDDRKGQAQSFGLLGVVDVAEGNDERGLDLLRRSADLAGETGFVWWRASMLSQLADGVLRNGALEEAAAHALEALAISRDLGDRLRLVRGLGRLARIAAARGDAARAGLLWGAMEAEEARGPIGSWAHDRVPFEQAVLARGGPEFEEGRAKGLELSLQQAVEEALPDLDSTA